MKKAEFMKYLENVEREDKANYVINNGDVASEILETGDFIQSVLPDAPALAKSITQSELTLEHDYVRLADYYSDFKEADTVDELVTDDEIDDFFDGVDPDEYESILLELGAQYLTK